MPFFVRDIRCIFAGPLRIINVYAISYYSPAYFYAKVLLKFSVFML